MIEFGTYDFKGNECKGKIMYDIALDSWIVKIEIPVTGFKNSYTAQEAVKSAIDTFDMELLKIKQAYLESR